MADLILIDRATIAQALSWIHYIRREYGMDEPREERALRAALAQAEPVQAAAGVDAYDMIDRFLRNNLRDDDYAEYSAALDSLYTAPQQADPVQRKPLTEDEIWGLAANCLNSVAGQLQFARAIERAHGIKEKA